jgi:hypothetical protein
MKKVERDGACSMNGENKYIKILAAGEKRKEITSDIYA